jgi:hypothetical protein
LQFWQLPLVQLHVVPPAGIVPTVQAPLELEPVLELDELLDVMPLEELPVVVVVELLLDEVLPLDEELPVEPPPLDDDVGPTSPLDELPVGEPEDVAVVWVPPPVPPCPAPQLRAAAAGSVIMSAEINLVRMKSSDVSG